MTKKEQQLQPLRAFVADDGTVWLEVWTLGAAEEEHVEPGDLIFRSEAEALAAAKRVKLKGAWAATTLTELAQTKKEKLKWTT